MKLRSSSQCASPSVDTILSPEHVDINDMNVDDGGELVFSNIENTYLFGLNYPLKSFYFIADISHFMDCAFSAESQDQLSILLIPSPPVDTTLPDVKLPVPKVPLNVQELKPSDIDNKLLETSLNPSTSAIKCTGDFNNVSDVNQIPKSHDLNQNPSSQQSKSTNVDAAINERRLFIQSFIRESSLETLLDDNISQIRLVDLCSASVATFLRVSHNMLYTNMINIMSLVILTRSYHRD